MQTPYACQFSMLTRFQGACRRSSASRLPKSGMPSARICFCEGDMHSIVVIQIACICMAAAGMVHASTPDPAGNCALMGMFKI